MASRFETVFGRRNLSEINEAFVQTNTKKVTKFGLSVFTGRKKIIFRLNLHQNRPSP